LTARPSLHYGQSTYGQSKGELLRPASESLLGFDQAGCFWVAGTGFFKPASRASLSARNRAVFSRVAARAASYSAIACCPSRSCCSFFLKAASARSRAPLVSVSNLVSPSRANPLTGQTFLPEERMPPVDVGCSTEPTPSQVICSARTPSGHLGSFGRCRLKA
jgi:hypothetical protein